MEKRKRKNQRPLRLAILPFQGISRKDLDHLIQDISFLVPDVSILKERDIPRRAYDPRRRQYRADILLGLVQRETDGHILGVTEVDLYAADLNFVFGMADFAGRAAVISLYRLRVDADEQTFRDRAAKEAVHEIGHTLGLLHCPHPDCVMYFSNSLGDTDRKGKNFCEDCSAKLGHIV
jgi:archaemetzincin